MCQKGPLSRRWPEQGGRKIWGVFLCVLLLKMSNDTKNRFRVYIWCYTTKWCRDYSKPLLESIFNIQYFMGSKGPRFFFRDSACNGMSAGASLQFPMIFFWSCESRIPVIDLTQKFHGMPSTFWVVATQRFLDFSPLIWGRWTHFDEHIFQMGWFNHQPVFFLDSIFWRESLFFGESVVVSLLPTPDYLNVLFVALLFLPLLFSPLWTSLRFPFTPPNIYGMLGDFGYLGIFVYHYMISMCVFCDTKNIFHKQPLWHWLLGRSPRC